MRASTTGITPQLLAMRQGSAYMRSSGVIISSRRPLSITCEWDASMSAPAAVEGVNKARAWRKELHRCTRACIAATAPASAGGGAPFTSLVDSRMRTPAGP